MPPLIKACLNGARPAGSHPALPLTPEALARDAASALAAGAELVHIHPRRPDGTQGLDAETVGSAVAAIHERCPGLRVGVTTIAGIEPDAEHTIAAVRSWTVLPDFASVNVHEAGSAEIAAALLEMGIGVEAGLWTADNARALVEQPWAARCERILVETVRARSADDALAAAQAMIGILDAARLDVPRLVHGFGDTAWPVLSYALANGYQTRIGLEDVFTLPDGWPAHDNAELVRTAVALSL